MACLPAKTQERFDTCGHLLVVADGMGAHAAGELASKIATERIAMQYFRSTETDRTNSLRSAVINANEEIYRRGQSNPEFHNMGTTASALVIAPEGAMIGHVGDSRVYRLRDGVLEQLTFDHSLVWEMEASGKSGVNYPKNVITRSLGPNPQVEIDIEGPMPVQVGDCYLVCSDGLTGLVEDTELGPLMECLPEEKLVRVLVDLANLRGGPDNISVVVARIHEPPGASGNSSTTNKRKSTNPAPKAMLFTAIACLVAAGLLGAIGMFGPMIIALILGLIAGVIAVVQWFQGSTPILDSSPARTTASPYRRYDARPTGDLHQSLIETVMKLREAADINNWMMDWTKVNDLQSKSEAAIGKREIKEAIRLQGEAIVETMNQLREQNNRAANETAIDY